MTVEERITRFRRFSMVRDGLTVLVLVLVLISVYLSVRERSDRRAQLDHAICALLAAVPPGNARLDQARVNFHCGPYVPPPEPKHPRTQVTIHNPGRGTTTWVVKPPIPGQTVTRTRTPQAIPIPPGLSRPPGASPTPTPTPSPRPSVTRTPAPTTSVRPSPSRSPSPARTTLLPVPGVSAICLFGDRLCVG